MEAMKNNNVQEKEIKLEILSGNEPFISPETTKSSSNDSEIDGEIRQEISSESFISITTVINFINDVALADT